MKSITKILLILGIILLFAFLLRTFGFQILNSIVCTSSAPPADLDKRIGAYILLMSAIALFFLRNWIKK
jgi:hypothetical protein